jgi:hypothetical protein
MARIFKYDIDDDFGFSTAVIKGEKHYYVEGYASTVDKDKAGETLVHSAQEDIYTQLKGENITLDLEHELWYSKDGKVMPRPSNDKIPVAKVVDAQLTSKGVWIKAELNQHISRFNEVWGSIKDGFLKAFSIAFYPVEKAGEGVIKRLNLVNITLTGSPVNPNATFLATMKSASAYLDSIAPHSPKNDSVDALSLSNTTIKGDKMTDKEENKVLTPEEEEEKKKKEKKETGDSKVEEAEVKCNDAKVKSEHDYEAEIKALSEKYDAEIKALKEETATLKAELEKPVMKATVTEVPKVTTEFRAKSPLGLIN